MTTNTSNISLLRQKDEYIIEAILRCKEIESYEILAANKCRLYLQAFSIADIATGDRTSISTNAWEGKPSNQLRTHIGWPIWGKPSTADWKVWRKVMQLSLTKGINKKSAPH